MSSVRGDDSVSMSDCETMMDDTSPSAHDGEPTSHFTTNPSAITAAATTTATAAAATSTAAASTAATTAAASTIAATSGSTGSRINSTAVNRQETQIMGLHDNSNNRNFNSSSLH
eukprot:Lankesteria_metandrocarpae@DN1707_c0_g1_i1.p2